MRKIEFNELKLNNNIDEQDFYELYSKNLQNKLENESSFEEPSKQYEICYLNILGGKIMLLNKNYINSENNIDQELFFDFSTAFKIYNLMLDIEECIEAEQYEFNDLYKDEKISKSDQIENLKKQDEDIFQNKQKEFDNIANSTIYKNYLKLKDENEKLKIEIQNLKIENQNLKEELKNKNILPSNISFFQKIINKFKNTDK